MERESVAFQRYSAIDGRDLTEHQIGKSTGLCGEPKLKSKITRSEIACYLSHMAVWRKIAEGEAEGGFIFEDDVELVSGAGRVMRAIVERELDWDILRFYSNKPKRLNYRMPIIDGYETGIARKAPGTTIGYAITRPAARHLLETSLPICRPVDVELKLWWRNGLYTRIVSPPLCRPHERLLDTSDIEPDRKNVRGRSRSLRFVRNLRYQIVYNWLIAYHRFDQPKKRQFF